MTGPKVKANIMAVMTCRHYREFDSAHAPKKGDDMWCFRCRTWGKCESLTKEFKIWCRGCKWSRGFGRNRLQAEIKASKHHNKFPEHEVWLAEGGDVVHRWNPNQTHCLVCPKSRQRLGQGRSNSLTYLPSRRKMGIHTNKTAGQRG